ncbi:uncharacterized protein MONOS_18654 [Monocercomonoides exilis]|uniref:uncharacterized protein n=1 Tax=Monocercomonoides exilis TaxID=2049356 RepID=UPI0035599E98|nr:hypothetical protein MONOS_18654 [Monocercomonoides exilis]
MNLESCSRLKNIFVCAFLSFKHCQASHIVMMLEVLFYELEDYDEEGQKRKIEEISGSMKETDENAIIPFFTIEFFDELNKMIEEKKINFDNVFALLKHIGYCKLFLNLRNYCFSYSLLSERFEKMIIIEEKKKEEKNERIFVDLCECYLMLSDIFSSGLLSICVPCLLNVALKKEESEEVQKEVEVALLALSCICNLIYLKQELYLNEIKEIIKCHQEYHNLTRLAYLSAWVFLINRLFKDGNLEEIIVNDLNFVRDARRELEELMKSIDLKREKEERRKGKDTKEEFSLTIWLRTLELYFRNCELRNEEQVEILIRVVNVFRAARDNYIKISDMCIHLLRRMAENNVVKLEDLLKGGAVDAVLLEIKQPTLNDKIAFDFLRFYMIVLKRLKEEKDDEMEEAKRKVLKMEMLEKLDEEGCEDIITSFRKKSYYYYIKFRNNWDYF